MFPQFLFTIFANSCNFILLFILTCRELLLLWKSFLWFEKLVSIFIYGQQSSKSPKTFDQIRICWKKTHTAEVSSAQIGYLWPMKQVLRWQGASWALDWRNFLLSAVRLGTAQQNKQQERKIKELFRWHTGETMVTTQTESTKACASMRKMTFCGRACTCVCVCVDTSHHQAAPAFQPLLPLRLQVICTVTPAE